MSIEAMKAALKALEYHQEQTRPIHKTQETITALRQAIEQAEKEATLQEISDIGQWDTSDMAHRSGGLSVEQKPVAWDDDAWGKAAQEMSGDFVKRVKANWESAPKREWVGLTDEEIDYIWGISPPDYEKFFDFPRAIEAKLKEKNGG
jgi:hypothetical protein